MEQRANASAGYEAPDVDDITPITAMLGTGSSDESDCFRHPLTGEIIFCFDDPP